MLLPKLENEHALLQRIAKNDEQAFKYLFSIYHHELGAFIHSLLNDRESTLEIVQDIFLKIWLQRAKLPDIGNFTSYLFIITRNYTLNKIRQITQEQKKYKHYLNNLENEVLFEVDHQNNRYEVLDKALSKLPPQQQRVFALRQQGLKNPEIARTLNISTASVAKYQQLAMHALAEFVKAYHLVLPFVWFFFTF
ncbi:sigma-70 family RNA polymerase sigma factor [Olivibacter sp. CPCC 100613]|uniref:RNA polymerase sigma factor n=1 Tax=Olivibacter sp. CPCC 100613 TaxID=3079931 RepID=UPI002FFA2AC6